MGDNGPVSASPDLEPALMPRIALYALLVCALSLAAAVVSFSKGSWLGIVWILMLGVASNMAWFYWSKAKADKAAASQCVTEK
ncbi:hypothetical protein [Streptomyces gobiensis]|uniref:hypothetical protein n=1 Tax=Streptomyces gobiensis TaxID=2875706 RepID=UPI001E2BA883|nr:hypothetical protein [Streptomyces gobiensis]UGY91070.1 hypothetical protein test1122_04590 [Streptomyces gobiensis]